MAADNRPKIVSTVVKYNLNAKTTMPSTVLKPHNDREKYR